MVKNPPANAGNIRDTRHEFDLWVGKIPWRGVMATHSSVLAWRIPWTEEPGGLPSMGPGSWTRLKRGEVKGNLKLIPAPP